MVLTPISYEEILSKNFSIYYIPLCVSIFNVLIITKQYHNYVLQSTNDQKAISYIVVTFELC